jgi:hypothetical protein
MPVEHRTAKVAVHDQGLLAVTREARRQVAGDQGLALARDRARDSMDFGKSSFDWIFTEL